MWCIVLLPQLSRRVLLNLTANGNMVLRVLASRHTLMYRRGIQLMLSTWRVWWKDGLLRMVRLCILVIIHVHV